MNISVLKDEEYRLGIESLIVKTLDEYSDHVDQVKLWEFLKTRIKNFTISYCISKSNFKHNEAKRLEQRIDYIDSVLATRQDANLITERRECKQELDDLYCQKAKGYQIRSRAAWVELGEKSTKYFLGLEKCRQQNNTIRSLKDQYGNVKLLDKDILNVASNFYESLYKTEEPSKRNVHKYIDDIELEKVLTEGDQQMCEGDISYNECEQAVKDMKGNKSPGLDGICVEFYQTFWPLIGKLLVDVFNQCFHVGKLPQSQRVAVMSLIFKKGDKDNISNYRPISLTNTDYRILAFILANRLQNVIGKVVSLDQGAYIKGRYMGYNTRLVSDIVDYYDKLNKPGIILSVDFSKAFDSLEWEFMFKTLKALNFGPSFIGWIQTIYNCPEACIKNNGYLSETFHLTRGIRQGCPVSSLLFILSVEMLAVNIRKCTSLKGFDFGVPQKPVKISQYADDLIAFLNNKDELSTILNILNKFGNLAGTKLNVSKCEALWLGSLKQYQNNCTLFGIKWPKALRCLGLFFGHDEELTEKLNWLDKLDKIDQLLSLWSRRDLSLYGKVQIVKTLALSQVVHVASILPIPKTIQFQLNSMLYKFVWSGKDKVKRDKIIRPYDKGGLNMVDVESMFMALKAAWLYRITISDPTESSWVQLANYFMRQLVGSNNVLDFILDKNIVLPVLKDIHPFYREVILGYSFANDVSHEVFCDNIFGQSLWGNRFVNVLVKRKKNALFLRNWIRSGVRKIGDLVFNNGVPDENYIYGTIQNQTNIHAEIVLVKKALKPYIHLLRNNAALRNHNTNPMRTMTKSRDIYAKLISNKFKDNSLDDFYPKLSELCTTIGIPLDEAFRNLLCSKIEIKLKEFNFKVVHDILPCNVNLVRWRKGESVSCDICECRHTIEHLLFSCHRATYIWNLVKNVYNIDVLYINLKCGFSNIESQTSHMICLLAFLLYKEWLLHSLSKKERSVHFPFQFYINELLLRDKIYKTCGKDINLLPMIESLQNGVEI